MLATTTLDDRIFIARKVDLLELGTQWGDAVVQLQATKDDDAFMVTVGEIRKAIISEAHKT